MRVAFYAPMKPPGHPVPSGDRRMARLLIEALRRGGHEVALASRLRSWDRGLDPARPARIEALGARVADRLVRRWRGAPDRPDAWFTYHLYHKAPDWLGPPVAAALGIPYVVAEASHAPQRAPRVPGPPGIAAAARGDPPGRGADHLQRPRRGRPAALVPAGAHRPRCRPSSTPRPSPRVAPPARPTAAAAARRRHDAGGRQGAVLRAVLADAAAAGSAAGPGR